MKKMLLLLCLTTSLSTFAGDTFKCFGSQGDMLQAEMQTGVLKMGELDGFDVTLIDNGDSMTNTNLFLSSTGAMDCLNKMPLLQAIAYHTVETTRQMNDKSSCRPTAKTVVEPPPLFVCALYLARRT